ncbi:hypothetical protein MXM41_04305 [Leclercia adecarboxylata]|uniref:hypothetical protein n=1 Tax=Leclercia adecarboxylata TaxID=83655 RepID=UPI002DB8F955|nr:hypothetical protein [Leclercia adecarboxylata]MEB6378160.1 hypothetical protein [Leclercia adecarboxylata]
MNKFLAYLWGMKGVDVSQASAEGSDIYKIVRGSEEVPFCTFKLRPGDRVLLSADGVGVGHKHLRADERVVSRDTLVEMVREISANN